jgi:hypothetical protein
MEVEGREKPPPAGRGIKAVSIQTPLTPLIEF